MGMPSYDSARQEANEFEAAGPLRITLHGCMGLGYHLDERPRDPAGRRYTRHTETFRGSLISGAWTDATAHRESSIGRTGYTRHALAYNQLLTAELASTLGGFEQRRVGIS